MDDDALDLRLGGATLTAVPAVHFRIAATEAVYRRCRQAPRPDAVAVELPPSVLAALVAWLRELGVGPSARLPCMLGLARYRGREAPAEQQLAEHDRVAYDRRVLELLCLSPTDSIIEAVRSALELGLPLYGIDLDPEDETNEPVLLQDPAHALGGRLGAYVRANAAYAATGRDPAVDPRRERAMAGRLKTLLRRHRRVLFTGGLAHWDALRDDLHGAGRAVPLAEATEDPYARVLVHPLLALRFMDAFPRLTTLYEDHRQAGFADDEEQTAERYRTCLRTLLQGVYETYFQTDDAAHPIDSTAGDLARLPAFQRFLLQRSAMGLRLSPDLGAVVHAAQGNLSRRFTAALTDALMDFDWASPEDFPGLPVLMPGEGPREGGRAELPWRWRDQPLSFRPPLFGPNITWPAVDFLLSALAYRALALTAPAPEAVEAEPFEGRLYDGLDVRATARARRRGEQGVYVRRRVAARPAARADTERYEPTVYLFRTGAPSPEADWGLYDCDMPAYFRPHVRDPHRLDEVAHRTGGITVTAVGYGYWDAVPAAYREVGISLKVLHGFTIFRPPHLSLDAEARWLEATGYEGQPVHRGGDVSALAALYEEDHGITLGAADWATDLVLLALPYARERVAVIAPDGFALATDVYDTARRLGKAIGLVPHSALPADVLRDASLQYHVPLFDAVGEVFPDEIIAHLGEPFRYRALVPVGMLERDL